MSHVEAHPNREQLAAFGLGRLDEPQALALEAHLAACPECSRALEGLAGDSFIDRLRGAATAPTISTSVDAKEQADAPTLTSGPVLTADSHPVPPELVNHPRYRILELLGAGGMGVVYKALHCLMERPVALKVIRRELTGDPAAAERFRREVRSAAALAHPNIVTAHDAEQAGDLHFLVMEYVEGTSLDRLVAGRGPLPVLQACDYAYQAALGLQHAHEHGMVHRDIKPQNLMLTPQGRVKILDFGLARFARDVVPLGETRPAPEAADARPDPAAALTLAGAVMGTPDYIAPEQVRDPHAADIRADIYSLGCTLYFLLSGNSPFPGASALDKLLAHQEQALRPLPEIRADLPPGLWRLIERMTAKDPSGRYQTPGEVARDLAVFTTPEGVRLPEPAEARRPDPSESRRLRTRLVSAVFFGGILALFVFLTTTDNQQIGERMETLYTACAVLGGTLLGLQFLMSLVGLGHHGDVGGHDFHDGGDFHDAGGHDGHASPHDVTHDTHVSWFVGLLTFRTVIAALTFFGLAGRAASAAEVSPVESLAAALAAGGAALFGVAWMMRSLYSLKAEGTVRIQRAVGQTGTVYLPIPGNKAGAGKVHLNLQNRTVEYQAVTAQDTLAAGSKILVVGVVSNDTVEVIPVPSTEPVTHV
jgi:serine/threonine protein kinase